MGILNHKKTGSTDGAAGSRPQSAGNLLSMTSFEVMGKLTSVYQDKIRPLEEAFSFDKFHSPCLTNTDIQAKPMVLLMGQYSVGKTTFISHLLGRPYPGAHIGPEPTTDKFVAIMDGPDRIIPGNAAAVNAELPFTALSRFGTSFLNKFQVAQVSSAALDNIILIDTPGILSGEKQRIGRAYDFPNVIEWFAERADMILLLFDAHKLDISDEFKEAIMALRGNDEKIRIVLNKADMIPGQQLLRVYGALMWSLGKVLQTPEVTRVYIGSFWDKPLQFTDLEPLLKAEQKDLFADLKALPRNAAIRKINEIVKRARMIQVHSIIISHLKKEMPAMFGKGSKQNELLNNLGAEFMKIERVHELPRGDFPNPERFKEKLANFKIDKFPKLDKRMFGNMVEALTVDLPFLMSNIPQAPTMVPTRVQNPFAMFEDGTSPTSPPVEELYEYNNIDRKVYADKFKALAGPGEDRLSGATLKPVLAATGLDNATLAKIWGLADWTRDGYLDVDEFVVAMHLCDCKKKNWIDTLPATLPPELKPVRNF